MQSFHIEDRLGNGMNLGGRNACARDGLYKSSKGRQMVDSTFGTLLGLASSQDTQVSQLARIAAVIASAIHDEAMSTSLRLELRGFKDMANSELPAHRVTRGTTHIIDQYGRDREPVGSAEAMDAMSRSSIPFGLAEVEGYASAPAGSTFQAPYSRNAVASISKAFPGMTGAFNVIERASFTSVLHTVRQQIFEWAQDNLGKDVPFPAGVTMASLTGQPEKAEEAALPAPVQAAVGTFTFNLENVSGSQVVVQSPGAHPINNATFNNADGLLQKLVAELSKPLPVPVPSDAVQLQLDALNAEVDKLRALASMPAPPASWVSQSVTAVKSILYGGTGGLIGNLATPPVTALLAHIGKAFGGN